MKVKICGITNAEDALLAERLGADALGFIFYSKSRRCVSPETAAGISEKLSPFTLKVGVFVNEDIRVMKKIIKGIGLNIVQLHGEEAPETIQLLPLPAIKSFRVKEKFDFSLLEKYKGFSFLLDSYSQNEFGGTGKKFDWDLIPKSIRRNIILAGGISSENIEEIMQNIKPSAVDLSSSLEKEPGKKDGEKMKTFFNKINQVRRMQWSS